MNNIFSLLINNILAKNRLYILAVSGGPDSMFLLEKMRLEGFDLVVAHVNYKKRESSDYDENLVRNYCQKYSLPCEVYQFQGSEYSSISNFQDKARQIRYDFLQKLADKYRTKYLVVAHHLNDHLETYLLQKRRKSLIEHWGLSAKTKQGKYWIIRPLLSLDKQQIYHYLTENEVNYAVDATNQLPIYQRNIIRQELADLSQEEKKNLEKEVKEKNQQLKKVKKLVKIAAKQMIFSASILKLGKTDDYSSEVYLRLLYFWINQATSGILQKRKKKLLNEIYKQLFLSKKKALILELGNGFRLVKTGNQVFIIS